MMKKAIKVLVGIVVLAVVGILAFHVLRTDHRMTTEEAKATLWTPHSEMIQWDGQNVHVLQQGQGTPVFLVHGLGGNSREFDELAEILQADHRVVRFDLPGFGLSDIPKYEGTHPDVIDIYTRFMDQMFEQYGGDSLILVGNSLGGMISWNAAVRFPNEIDKLVLLAPAGYDLKEITEQTTGWLGSPIVKFMIAKGLDKDMSKGNLTYCTYHDDNIDPIHFENKYAANNREGNLDWMITLGTNEVFPDTADIPKVACPTLIIWGTDDPVIPYCHAARFDRDIPNSRLITYKECGHVPMIEYPKKTAKDIEEFAHSVTLPTGKTVQE